MSWFTIPSLLAQIIQKLNAVAAVQTAQSVQLAAILAQGVKTMAAIDDLQSDVAAEDTVIGSAIALIQGFSAQLAAAGVDPAKLAALRSDIQARTSSLAAAVAANTPAAIPGT